MKPLAVQARNFFQETVWGPPQPMNKSQLYFAERAQGDLILEDFQSPLPPEKIPAMLTLYVQTENLCFSPKAPPESSIPEVPSCVPRPFV